MDLYYFKSFIEIFILAMSTLKEVEKIISEAGKKSEIV
jgi:hypothetical protein